MKKKNKPLRPLAGKRFNPLQISVSITSILFGLLVLVLVFSDAAYLYSHKVSIKDIFHILTSQEIRSAIYLSVITSICSLILVVIFSVPIAYALSRQRFPGKIFFNVMVDVPLILPPVVIGVSLLAFFGSPVGLEVKALLQKSNIYLISGFGIVLCQFIVSIPYCIRACKATFDSNDKTLENVAMTLGCSEWQAFKKVSLPLARNGLIAGAIIAWARAIGVFGPLMVFVGTGPRVRVMPTSIWLELSVGNIETSLTLALMMVILAGSALMVVHLLTGGKDYY